MIPLHLRYNFSTIAILSGGVRNNSATSRIIKHLKQKDPNLNFIGIAGANCDTQFKNIYAYSESFTKQPFEALNHYREELAEWRFSPYMLPVHNANSKVLKKLEAGKIYDDLVKSKVSAIINVGNWSFARLFLKNVNEYYKKQNILKPPVFLYDRSIYYRKVEHEELVDYQFYSLPRQPDSFGKYVFPSTCIGYESLFNTYRFLAKYRKDHTFDYKEKTSFSEEVEVLIQKARTEYRNGLSVGQDAFVIALAPGNTQEQINFTMARIPETIKKFFESEEMRTYPIQKFELWVIPPSEKDVNLSFDVPISTMPTLKIRYIQAADRIPALCASDVSLAHNGSSIVDAAACHLPTIVIDNRSMPQAYLSYLFNRFQSPLNIATQRMGYQQLLSNDSAIPEKLSSLLINHFLNPKLKYFYVDTYETALKQMLEKSGKNPYLNVEKSGLETSAEMILGEVKAYEQKDHGKVSRDWRNKRLSTIQS